jgi:tRNA threonylcarbamoyladenosine biosynthesis protein TsaE
MQQTYTINSLDELAQFAESFLAEISKSETEGVVVIGISGDLGAGKTTFVQTLAKLLGVSDVVTSPTFTIMKGYETAPEAPFATLIHMDAYRIEDQEELRPLRLAELMQQPRTLICIEWAERIHKALPLNTHFLSFALDRDEVRHITYKQGVKSL